MSEPTTAEVVAWLTTERGDGYDFSPPIAATGIDALFDLRDGAA